MKLSKVFLLIAFLIPVEGMAAGVPMNTVAIHPANRNEMYAASDSAGLFKSTNGGLNWVHVVSLPVSFLQVHHQWRRGLDLRQPVSSHLRK